MEKLKIILISVFMLIFSVSLLFSEERLAAEIDWPDGILTVYGYGDIIPQEKGNFVEWQYKAVTDANVDLMKNFFKALKSLRVDNFHNASDLLLNNQNLNRNILDYFGKIKKKDLIYFDTYVKIAKRYKFYGPDGFIKYFVTVGSDLDDFPKYNDYVFTTDFTGLVIDARGLGKQTAVSPKIYDENHNLIYSADFVDPEYFLKWGIVQYTNTPYYDKYVERVGKNPFRIIALRENKLIETDIEISDENAKILLQSELTKQRLKEGRVIIIIDSDMKEKVSISSSSEN